MLIFFLMKLNQIQLLIKNKLKKIKTMHEARMVQHGAIIGIGIILLSFLDTNFTISI